MKTSENVIKILISDFNKATMDKNHHLSKRKLIEKEKMKMNEKN